MSLQQILKFSFLFVKDKFTGVLQLFVIPNFTFISIKLFNYFSCVIRNAPSPASFTKIKYPLASSQTAKFLHKQLHFYIIIVLYIESLKLLFRAVNSNCLLQVVFSSVFPNIVFYPFWLFGFQFQSSLVWLSRSCFFHVFFHGPALGKGLIISGYTYFGGLVVSMLASGTQDRGFDPD